MPIKRVVHFSLGKDWFSLPVDIYQDMLNDGARLNILPNPSHYGALKLGRKPYDWKDATKLENILPAKEPEAA